MIEHRSKQKNHSTILGGKQAPTLKIKNITFCRWNTKTIDQEVINFHLRMGRNMSHKNFDGKNKNKENNIEAINNYQNNDKKHRIADMFSIKSVNLKNSQKLFIPLKLLGDSTNLKINQFRELTNNKPGYAPNRQSQSKNGRRNQKSKTALNQNKRLSSSEQRDRKSRAQTENFNQRHFNRQKKLFLNTNDKVFETKFENYRYFLQSVAELHQTEISFQEYMKPHTVFVGRGNNSKLVKDTLKKRWWLRVQDKKGNQQINFNEVNFAWTQTKVNQYYVSDSDLSKNLHNHFEFNGNLGNKKQLFLNMKSYYESLNQNPFQVLPMTFHIKSLQDVSFKQFKTQFLIQKQNLSCKGIWIVKPGQNSNRGRGITIHTEIQQIQKLISEQNYPGNTQGLSQAQTFIVQKYIQRPFLYQKRKFDIRCYYLLVCINQSIKAYWYREGYIRTSCFQFNCNQQSQSNLYVHLTNDAVQKNSENYGKFEDGNKIDYNTFKKYLTSKNHTKKLDFDLQIYEKMKEIAYDSIKSTYPKLRKTSRPIFQIFGLDFMIDEEFKPWLIQVNTNPCLETSCLVLQRIIPKMLDDAFQLSVDFVFPAPKTWPSSRRHLVPNHQYSGFQLIFDEKTQGHNKQM